MPLHHTYPEPPTPVSQQGSADLKRETTELARAIERVEALLGLTLTELDFLKRGHVSGSHLHALSAFKANPLIIRSGIRL